MLAIIESVVRPWRAYIEDLGSQQGAAADKLYRLMRSDYYFLATEPYQLGQLLMLPEIRHGQFSEFVHDTRSELIATYEKYIEQGVEQGDFVITDLYVTTHSIFGMGEALWAWYKPTKTHSPELVAETVADLAMRGILKNPSELTSIKSRYAEKLPRRHPPTLLQG